MPQLVLIEQGLIIWIIVKLAHKGLKTKTKTKIANFRIKWYLHLHVGGVCQFSQGAALFPIWFLLFIGMAMGGRGGSGCPLPRPPPPHFLEENLIYKKTSFCGVGYPWTLLQEWACNPLQFSRPPALLTFVPCHFQFCSHGPDKGIKKLTNCFFVSVSQAIFSYWVTSNLFTIGQVALLKHPAARKAMGIPEMITHPSSQDPGGFWENMKAGTICCSQGFKGRNPGNA